MPIVFTCDSCFQKVETPTDAAGQKGRCPHCGHIQVIPEKSSRPTTPPTLTTSRSTVDSLLGDVRELSQHVGNAEQEQGSKGQWKNDDPEVWGEDRYASHLIHEQNRVQATSRRLMIPAVGLIVSAGALYVASVITVLVFAFYAASTPSGQSLSVPALGIMLLIVAWNCLLATLGIVGATHMRQVRSYSQAIGGAMLMCLPHAAWPLGVLFGIWALAQLARAEIRDTFRRP